MKQFLMILVCVFAFSACDDGDLIVDTIDFDEVQTSECSETGNNLLFKLKESESLILNIPEDSFTNDATPEGKPTELVINTTNQVVYNFYDGKVGSEKICNLIDPGFPNVNTQWNAASGIIEITTDVQKTVNETEKSTRITGYKNVIVFKNITFKKEDGTTQFYDIFSFGDYLQKITPLPLDFEQLLFKCDNGLVYKFNESESLTLDIDPELILNVVTPIDKPRTGTIGLVTNKLVYRFYETGGVLEQTYFCQAKDPTFPTVKEEWLGKEGGVIEVTTTTSGPNSFKHTIVLKNVSLAKGNSDFQLGSNYIYGELSTTK
jgi:hypothetical protein